MGRRIPIFRGFVFPTLIFDHDSDHECTFSWSALSGLGGRNQRKKSGQILTTSLTTYGNSSLTFYAYMQWMILRKTGKNRVNTFAYLDRQSVVM